MSLLLMMAVLFVAGALGWLLEAYHRSAPHWITLAGILLALLLLATYLPEVTATYRGAPVPDGSWDSLNLDWIPRFGIRFSIAIDGLSFVMLALTLLAGLFGLLMCWREIKFRTGFFCANYLWVLTGVVGVFVARDLFLFFCFWEIMLVPMALLIAIWGHGRRMAAAIQFFIFTQASSLFLLVASIGAVLVHFQQSGYISFDPGDLSSTLRSGFGDSRQAFWLMLGFFIAFAVKLPVVFLHIWLPDAHTRAPTAGSILLAAVLLKTGAYGLIRFALPLFPDASAKLAPLACVLGAAGILYGALMAFAQTDLKRLIAYSSISHMGFVLLGIYSLNETAMQGAIAQMVAHGFSTAALFGLAGALYHRMNTRNMQDLSGLSVQAPKLAAGLLFFTVSAMGLPGLANFVGEILILAGSFPQRPWLTAVAAVGLIGAAIYGLKLLVHLLFGTPKQSDSHTSPVQPTLDLQWRELLALALPLLFLVWLGLHPLPMLQQTKPWSEQVLTPGGPS